ncbi:hypothetical protein C8R45DRAFT_1170419 [Mycena sanguinolenta]|nr:hypothetical protein C8R45DRAFT_1170419 [Mycena sanguinolenta]
MDLPRQARFAELVPRSQIVVIERWNNRISIRMLKEESPSAQNLFAGFDPVDAQPDALLAQYEAEQAASEFGKELGMRGKMRKNAPAHTIEPRAAGRNYNDDAGGVIQGHDCHGPGESMNAPTDAPETKHTPSAVTTGFSQGTVVRSCSNCLSTSTSRSTRWRNSRLEEGHTICDPCYQYEGNRRRPRPALLQERLEMRRDVKNCSNCNTMLPGSSRYYYSKLNTSRILCQLCYKHEKQYNEVRPAGLFGRKCGCQPK